MLKEKLELLLENLSKISEDKFIETDGGRFKVLWLMDRQKPSVDRDYSFDEERFGVTKDGKIIWGFDSGCSCPSPWSAADFGDENYEVKEYKEFQLEKFPDFDVEYEEEIISKIDEVLK